MIWTVNAASGESLPPGGSALEPSILLSGGNELPAPPAGLLPRLGVNWYGTRVIVDWHNATTGASGRSVSDEAAWQQKSGIPINRTWTGTGTVAFTVTVETGAGWRFVNPQNAVCQGTITVVPGAIIRERPIDGVVWVGYWLCVLEISARTGVSGKSIISGLLGGVEYSGIWFA